MERFIVDILASQIVTYKFKIQYGEIYRPI